ncbi:hypothetical protein AV530_016481 [Patagioenas fasciata monilis]|uniref:Uncharacterized protein n=1 Tax=Patagioenas fasciata monilis TaxID=372326 RepID=A0A1V4J2K2_PATFA|nr:hypothetical protein AV530_016481 [Patagioenas fasciata monilis]
MRRAAQANTFQPLLKVVCNSFDNFKKTMPCKIHVLKHCLENSSTLKEFNGRRCTVVRSPTEQNCWTHI